MVSGINGSGFSLCVGLNKYADQEDKTQLRVPVLSDLPEDMRCYNEHVPVIMLFRTAKTSSEVDLPGGISCGVYDAGLSRFARQDVAAQT